MNRILIPAAVAALVAGCARPAVTGLEPYSAEPYYAPPETTVIVREVHYQEPVVYVDTVYLEEEPVPVQPVYVQEEYNEYNTVYVHEQVVLQPRERQRGRGWSPRRHDPPPRGRGRHDGSRRDRNQPREPEKPKVVPKHPVKRTNAPVLNDREKSPVPPTPPAKPTPPKRQAPAQGGNVPADPVQLESPKQAPTPPVDKPADPTADEVQVQVGMTQAGRK